jgi:hypothetical protein
MACTDTFCVTLMIYVGCQFDLLGLALKNMKKNMLLKSDTGAYKTREKGFYRIQILTLNNSLRLPVIKENVGNKPQKNVKDIGRWRASEETALQNNVIQFGWEEEDQTPSTVKSYKQVEKETMTYIKECIRYHQSLLM